MSLEIRHQGDKIEAVFKLKNTDGTYKDLDIISEFYANIYTTKDNIQEFSKTGGGASETIMTRISSTEYLCIISGTNSLTMTPGLMIMETKDADRVRQAYGYIYKLEYRREIYEKT